MPTPPRVADVFHALATTYDQTGMPFFRPVGARLVEQLAPDDDLPRLRAQAAEILDGPLV